MSKRFFPTSPWPKPQEVSHLFKNDELFLSLYAILSMRHKIMSLPTPSSRSLILKDYVDAWIAYRDFFNLCLNSSVIINLPPLWIQELLSEASYFFSQYHEFISLHRNKTEETPSSLQSTNEHDESEIPIEPEVEYNGGNAVAASGTALSSSVLFQEDVVGIPETEMTAVWSIGNMLGYLHSLSELVPTSEVSSPVGFKAIIAYYSYATLGQIYVKLGNYSLALQCFYILQLSAGDGLYTRNTRQHLKLHYYASFALIMSRKFEEAIKLLNRTLAFFHKTHFVLNMSDSALSESGAQQHRSTVFIKKQSEKMLSLLALAYPVVPGSVIEEVVRKALREVHGDRLERISSGVGGTDVDEIFQETSPGYLSYAGYINSSSVDSDSSNGDDALEYVNSSKDIYDMHLFLLKSEVASRSIGLAQLRSFMRIYTNMSLSKLASYANVSEQTARDMLTALKVKSMSSTSVSTVASSTQGNDPLSFWLNKNELFIEETKQSWSPASFFIRGIESTSKFAKDITPSTQGPTQSFGYRYRGGGGSGGGRR
jgi:translation initiation factor 3 subunit L